jgi:hypothetical protein
MAVILVTALSLGHQVPGHAIAALLLTWVCHDADWSPLHFPGTALRCSQ